MMRSCRRPPRPRSTTGLVGARPLAGCALLLACAGRPPPPPAPSPAAALVRPPPPRPAAAPGRPRPPDPPDTRRVGSDNWSVAVGEDWAREQSRGGGVRFRLDRDGANVTLNVYRVPRPRGTADEALDEVAEEFREELARRGIVGDDARPARIDDAPGRTVVFRAAHADRPVRAQVRAVARGTRFGIVACISPQGPRGLDPRCSAIIESLTIDEAPPAPTAGSTRVALGPASVLVPEGWLDVTHSQSLHAVHSEPGRDATRVTVEGGDDEGGADAIFEAVDRYHAARHAAVLRRVRTRARDTARLDFEATFTEPPGTVVNARLAARGRYVYYLSCAEPADEAPARGQCTPVLASFRFDAP